MASTNFLVTLFGVLFFSSAYCSKATSPILMWSNTNAFSGKNVQEIDLVSIDKINEAMRSESNSFSKYFTKSASSPELIIVFVEPKLSSEQISILAHAHEAKPSGGALSNLKSFIENSQSSIVFPYVTSSVGSELISSLTSSIQGSVYSVGTTSATLTMEELKEQINGGKWAALNNQVTDLLVVQFSSPAVVSMFDDSSVHKSYASDDSNMETIISSLGNTAYIAIFTSNGADSQHLDSMAVAELQGRSEMVQFRDNYNQEHDLLYTTNWPVGVVEALLVMAPFVAILFIGICCTMQIQSDLKFHAEKAILKKQYM